VLAEALLEGDAEAFYRKGRERALAKDSQMLRFFLSRFLPKERCVRVPLYELNGSSDAVEALAAIIRAAASGQITPSEAEKFSKHDRQLCSNHKHCRT
jgi:hypothetical protein